MAGFPSDLRRVLRPPARSRAIFRAMQDGPDEFSVGYSTPSREIATFVLILARHRIEAGGGDPLRLELESRVDRWVDDANVIRRDETWSLCWVDRVEHPVTGRKRRFQLMVDWRNMEIIE